MMFAVEVVLFDVMMLSLQQGWNKFQNCLTVLSKHLLIKVNKRNTRKICDVNDVALVSLLLTLKILLLSLLLLLSLNR